VFLRRFALLCAGLSLGCPCSPAFAVCFFHFVSRLTIAMNLLGDSLLSRAWERFAYLEVYCDGGPSDGDRPPPPPWVLKGLSSLKTSRLFFFALLWMLLHRTMAVSACFLFGDFGSMPPRASYLPSDSFFGPLCVGPTLNIYTFSQPTLTRSVSARSPPARLLCFLII